jgi:heme/copper-type cytochrome/quinol oxidase subunit 1
VAARADTSAPRPDWMRGKVTSWLTTVDHKRVGALYVGTSLVFLLLGGLLALFLRAQLATPNESFLGVKSYGQVLTLHATTMIYLFAVPIFAGLGSHLVPLLIGARNVAFPRLNALSYWLFVLGGVVLFSSFLAKGGPASGGWTGSVPLAEKGAWPGNGVNLLILALLLLSLSSLLAAINLVVTIKNMRTTGMTWMRMPLFAWSMLVYSVLLLLIVPTLAAALTMLLLDREAGTHFFIASQGGSTALFRHAFWFLGRPEVYILILPPIGIVSEVLPVFSRRPIFNYAWVVYSLVALGCLFLLVWAHRTLVVGVASYVHVVVIVTTVAIAAVVGVIFFDWLATLWHAAEGRFDSPLLFALGFLFLFGVGCLSRLGAAVFSMHGSAEVVARLHYALYGSSLFAILAALHYWWPKLYGRLLGESLARLSFWLLFAGFNVAFFFEYLLGRLGMPSGTGTYSQGGHWEAYNAVSTAGSGVMAVGIIVLLVNVFRTQRSGRRAGNDPWRADTLEWYTTSPPPEHNFDSVPAVRSVRPLYDLRRHLEESGAG